MTRHATNAAIITPQNAARGSEPPMAAPGSGRTIQTRFRCRWKTGRRSCQTRRQLNVAVRWRCSRETARACTIHCDAASARSVFLVGPHSR